MREADEQQIAALDSPGHTAADPHLGAGDALKKNSHAAKISRGL
jgi:hypothetical protein